MSTPPSTPEQEPRSVHCQRVAPFHGARSLGRAVDSPFGVVEEAASDQLRSDFERKGRIGSRNPASCRCLGSVLRFSVGANELDHVTGAFVVRLSIVRLEVVDQRKIAGPTPTPRFGKVNRHLRLGLAVSFAILRGRDSGEVVGREQQSGFANLSDPRLGVEGVAMVTVGDADDSEVVFVCDLLPVYACLMF